MAGLDWASFADNLVREGAVLIFEMPETFDLMQQIYDAGECITQEAKAAAEALEQ